MPYAEKAWVKFENIRVLQRPDVHIVHGSVKSVDLETKTAVITRDDAETTEKYDFFVGATGLRRGWPAVPQSLTRETYLEEMRHNIEAVISSKGPILVVGGGKSLGIWFKQGLYAHAN
jgi:NADPH-dependent 2,4-dienoyl-CoA reductase/sulfur reductase-like enzyme